MTTPAAPSDPGALPVPAEGVVRTPANFEAPLVTWGGNVRTAVQALRALLVSGGLLGAGGRLEQSYVKPLGGIPASDVASDVVKGDGTVTLNVALTQAQYDALATKGPTTGYDIVPG